MLQECFKVFNEQPEVFVKVSNGKALYELVIYAPYLHNVGRGYSLQDALKHLKELNHVD